MVYILLPILFLLFMRFSLLKWYVDPIAAFTAPLFIFLVTLSSNIEKGHDFLNAFSLSLSDFFTTTSLIYSIILFILGLLASFSFKRKEEKSLSYKIIYKIIK